MELVQWNIESEQKDLNTAKELIVRGLVDEKILSEKQAENILQQYAIVLYKKGMLGKLWDKLRGINDTKKWRMHLVKSVRTVSLPCEKEDEEATL